MSKIFRDYDQTALDAQYDQRVWSPHMDEVIERYAKASDAAIEAALRAPTLIGRELDHFTLAETLADPRSPLGSAALAMLE